LVEQQYRILKECLAISIKVYVISSFISYIIIQEKSSSGFIYYTLELLGTPFLPNNLLIVKVKTHSKPN